MSVLVNGFLIALVVVAGMFSYILAHESTHLLLADEAEGICIGRCRYNSPNLSPSEGISIASAFGDHNEESMKEFWPTVVGLVAMVGIIVGGIFCLEKKGEIKE